MKYGLFINPCHLFKKPKVGAITTPFAEERREAQEGQGTYPVSVGGLTSAEAEGLTPGMLARSGTMLGALKWAGSSPFIQHIMPQLKVHAQFLAVPTLLTHISKHTVIEALPSLLHLWTLSHNKPILATGSWFYELWARPGPILVPPSPLLSSLAHSALLLMAHKVVL